jgi:S-adenosylmethionine:tRNA ribosyltransferase-isomerase
MSEVDAYDYQLPKDLIAQQPLARRADARLMVVHRAAGTIAHHHIRDLPELLRAGDALVLNETRVVPARLMGHRTSTRGRWEGLFLSSDGQGNWRLLAKSRGKLVPGETIELVSSLGIDALKLRLLAKDDNGVWFARPEVRSSVPGAPKYSDLELLELAGRVPLPHYIRGGEMESADVERYQTVFARRPGAVAAPTAGLHFSQDLLDRLEQAALRLVKLTLHVGLDTFRPITAETLAGHPMHAEWGEIDAAAVATLLACRGQGGRIVAVGTTSVRVLETAAAGGVIVPWQGETRLFIRPPYEFRAVDALLTNFHLPRTTLLVLVRAFGGDELIRQAYEEALREEYRFYSYGDAMLIL